MWQGRVELHKDLVLELLGVQLPLGVCLVVLDNLVAILHSIADIVQRDTQQLEAAEAEQTAHKIEQAHHENLGDQLLLLGALLLHRHMNDAIHVPVSHVS